MTQDEIIEMAQECKLIGMRPHLDGIYTEALIAFAKLVAEKERGACARLCDELAVHPEYASEVTKLAALVIRARDKYD
jgi:hypothetical protein